MITDRQPDRPTTNRSANRPTDPPIDRTTNILTYRFVSTHRYTRVCLSVCPSVQIANIGQKPSENIKQHSHNWLSSAHSIIHSFINLDASLFDSNLLKDVLLKKHILFFERKHLLPKQHPRFLITKAKADASAQIINNAEMKMLMLRFTFREETEGGPKGLFPLS